MSIAVAEAGGRQVAPSRRRGAKPQYHKRIIAHAKTESIVSTRQLRDALDPLFHVLEAVMTNGHEEDGNTGATEIVAERAGMTLGLDPDSVKRRFFGVRELETRTTTARFGDALLMALGSTLRDQNVPELPAGIDAALERIDVYCEMHGRRMSDRDRFSAAADLFEFTLLMIHGVEPWYGKVIDWPAAEKALAEYLDNSDVQLALEAA